jgi:phosphoglycolate phosphatase
MIAPLAIFDLDGTLHRTEAALTPAIRLALADVSASIPPDAEIEALYGEPIPLISEALLPNAGEAAHRAFITALKARQAQTVPVSAESYEGVPEMLSTLSESGWMLAVCSNAGLDYIELVTGALGIRSLFGVFSGLLPGHDKADRIGRLASESGGFAAVIGDRYLDFEAADAVGLPSIGCAWGYGAARELAAATVVARRPSEIPALLEELRRGRQA